MATGPKKVETRGGYRAKAGRKGVTLATSEVESMLRAARKREKVEGRSIDEVLLDLIYAPAGNKTHRLQAIKLWKEYTMIRITDDPDAPRSLKVPVYLPDQRPDPGKIVSIDRKEKEHE